MRLAGSGQAQRAQRLQRQQVDVIDESDTLACPIVPWTRKECQMIDHTRVLTYPAVVGLLQDGQWHDDGELTAVTTFPQEWLAHLEHEGFELERQGESVRLTTR